MDTYHAAHWSDLSYSSSSEEEENRYTGIFFFDLAKTLSFPNQKQASGFTVKQNILRGNLQLRHLLSFTFNS